MKQFILCTALLLAGLACSAQSLALEVIGATGFWAVTPGGLNVHQTLGEVQVGPYFNSAALSPGFHQFFPTTTPVNNLEQVDWELEVFPNPSTDWVLIKSEVNEELSANLYNLMGNHLYSVSVPASGSAQFDLSMHPAGWYVLRLSDPGGRSISKKVLKISN